MEEFIVGLYIKTVVFFKSFFWFKNYVVIICLYICPKKLTIPFKIFLRLSSEDNQMMIKRSAKHTEIYFRVCWSIFYLLIKTSGYKAYEFRHLTYPLNYVLMFQGMCKWVLEKTPYKYLQQVLHYLAMRMPFLKKKKHCVIAIMVSCFIFITIL